jgi:hypothetical protein
VDSELRQRELHLRKTEVSLEGDIVDISTKTFAGTSFLVLVSDTLNSKVFSFEGGANYR